MTNITFSIKSLALLACVSLLVACGNDMSRINDSDLRKKVQECDYAVNMTAAEHQVCGNYKRECKRRLESEGRFVCN